MRPELFYYEIPLYKSKLVETILDTISTKNESEWKITEKTFDWSVLEIDKKILLEDTFEDTFLKRLSQKIDFAGHVFKMLPNKFYDWHKDAERQTAINILLNTNSKSYLLFTPRRNSDICDFIEMKYKPDTYYVINTKMEHMVVNFDQTRYILSISFDSKVDYVDLVKIIMEM